MISFSYYDVVTIFVKVGWPKLVQHLCRTIWWKPCINIDAWSGYTIPFLFQYVFMSDCFERIMEENKWADTGEWQQAVH